MFVAFAPAEKARIAIAVIVENSGFGAKYAAPIASLMMEKYLKDSISTKRQPLLKSVMETVTIDQAMLAKSHLDSLNQNAVIKKNKP